MSLILAAKHLESHGRGPDSHLVHMSTGELQALRGLAHAHGGEITINPRTGLPEAGFLSAILPTVLGAAGTAMGIPTWALIGGVGLAATALTGDLGQGLMAGLGAWSGTNLAGDISKVGAAQTVEDASQVGNAVNDVRANAALQPTNAAVNTNIGSNLMGQSQLVGQTGGLSNIGAVGTQASGPVMPGMSNTVGPAQIQDMYNAPSAAQAQTLANQTQSSFLDPQAAKNFNAGWNKITESPSSAWNFVKDNPWHVAAAASPFVTAGLEALQPKPYQAPKSKKNPFNLKYLSPDFQGTFPEQPNPPYQAQYRDYVANPYVPGQAAAGGLQTANYAKGDLVKYGLGLLQQQEAMKDENPYTGPGIAEYEKEYEGMSPMERTHAKMQALFKKKNAIKPVGSLGAINTDPAILAQQAIADEQARAKTSESKEGGLQGYALGGLSMGHLGGYSDGGRLLKGPGDGVSDSIPASIGHKQPARLAEGEFVIPARIVSELGNGSTDAGAKRLYAMMDRIKAKRAKTKNIAADTKAYNYLPA